MFGLVTRSRYDAARAEADRQRTRAEAAINRAVTAEFNRSQILHQLADADAANARLHHQNKELREQLASGKRVTA